MENTNIIAVNGSKKVNSVVLFSPIYFLDEWLNGATYQEAVFNAYNREVEKYEEYDSPQLPISLVFSSSQVLSDSEQIVGGNDPQILWNNFAK